MRILISYQNGNFYGGSEIFHHELIQGLSEYKDLDITVATLTEPNLDFHLWQDIIKLGIRVTDLFTILHEGNNFDLIICSQPSPTYHLCVGFPTTPKISIIHSILRSEEPVKHESIYKYIAVQIDIKKGLKQFHNIESELIYNPVDETRFNKDKVIYEDSLVTKGIFVGDATDSLRTPMLEHLVENCIKNGWHLGIISRNKRDFNSNLISYIEPTYNTEKYLKNVDFAAGLRGRVAIESYMCVVPFYAYDVDASGNILKVELVSYIKTRRFERDFVCSQYYNLIQKYGITNNR